MASTTGQRSSRSAKPGTGRNRRQEYIDAAANVFYRRGYDTATVGDIAEALDVTKAALYYYVDSKEELLYEIIREMHLLNLSNLEIAETHTGDAQSRLWNYFVGHARVNLEHLEKATVVYRDLSHLSSGRRREIVFLRDKTQSFVRDLLTQAVTEKTVCTLVNIDLASIEMFTTVNAVFSWYQPSGILEPGPAARHVADFVIAGVSCTGDDDRSCPRHHPRNV
ncbi:TetR family transcriptional regulator (plasmid) [Rhodococcus qingshengii]|uniref:TetR/AcrR family transcriptional regulator n=1 Tax=Rhodococcus qingshengii TaxID=334542 RepID=UPI0007E57E86|nr:TetR/AcrR family transcriptional regulator [Rhodococcus qingshengii]BCF86389.1 TetR family transcriptional regulator [Rhodococcus qingshengii]